MLDLQPGHHADPAQISKSADDPSATDGIEEMALVIGTVEQAFIFLDLLGGNASGTGCRMRRIGIAMEELDGIFRRSIGDGVINLILHGNTAHRNGPIGQRLGHGGDIRDDIKFLRRVSPYGRSNDDLIQISRMPLASQPRRRSR